jgi:hypothetical protein
MDEKIEQLIEDNDLMGLKTRLKADPTLAEDERTAHTRSIGRPPTAARM